MPASLGRIFNKRLLLRLAALAVLIALYYYIVDWAPLQTGLRRLVAVVLGLFGRGSSATVSAGTPSLLMADGRVYAFTENCAYVALYLLAAPFIWRFGRPIASNLIRQAAFAAGLLALDIVRLTAAILLNQGGAPWKRVHDIPDLAIHIAVMALAVLSALRADDPEAAQRSKTTRPSTIV